MQKSEQQPVCDQLHHGQAQETEEKHPTGGEEPDRASRAVASKAIDDSAGQEHPEQDVDGGRADNHGRPTGPVDKGAQVVENGAESDDRGLEGDADARSLVAELLHPVVVDAVGRRIGSQAGAEMTRDHLAQRQRERQADENGHRPHAGEQRRRAVHATDPVDDRPKRAAAGLRAAAHASAAHDNRQFSSQSVQTAVHFLAALSRLAAPGSSSCSCSSRRAAARDRDRPAPTARPMVDRSCTPSTDRRRPSVPCMRSPFSNVTRRRPPGRCASP